jgi:PAS domain S-box-containing protein
LSGDTARSARERLWRSEDWLSISETLTGLTTHDARIAVFPRDKVLKDPLVFTRTNDAKMPRYIPQLQFAGERAHSSGETIHEPVTVHESTPSPVFNIDDSFRNVFDAVHDGIFISDPATGRFIEVNQPGCDMFGYSKAELIGSDIGFLSSGTHPYTLDMAIENSTRARSDGGQIFEWHCKARNGVLFWTEISIRYTEIGHIPAVVAIVRDITERKRLDEKLRLAVLQAFAASAAKSSFLASMSHELRTPLNAIIGFSDLMLTQTLGPLGNPRYREYINDIHGSGLQLLALIDDLLDLSRIDAGEAHLIEQTVSLRHVIAAACRMVELQAKEAKLQIAVELPPDLPDVRGDERRIKQIVLNLLSNAVKFTPAGGTITITAKKSESGLLLEVSDTGIGIAEADLPRVLERFGQVDSSLSRKHKGTGLGLPLVKQMIELHGGSLSIKSEVNVGTTAAVAFPRERVIAATRRAAA